MNSDLSKLISTTSNARLRLRLLAVSHFIDGKNRTEIASFLKVSRLSVNKWIKKYLDYGIEALTEKPRTGRPSRLGRVYGLLHYCNSRHVVLTGRFAFVYPASS